MQSIHELIDRTSQCLRNAKQTADKLQEARRVEGAAHRDYLIIRAQVLDEYLGTTSAAEAERRAEVASTASRCEWEEAKQSRMALETLYEVWREGIFSGRQAQRSLTAEQEMTQ